MDVDEGGRGGVDEGGEVGEESLVAGRRPHHWQSSWREV